jgi:DNA-binding GntR family transcriptional regulator
VSPARRPGPVRATPQSSAAGLAEHVYQLLKAEIINDQFKAEERIVI